MSGRAPIGSRGRPGHRWRQLAGSQLHCVSAPSTTDPSHSAPAIASAARQIRCEAPWPARASPPRYARWLDRPGARSCLPVGRPCAAPAERLYIMRTHTAADVNCSPRGSHIDRAKQDALGVLAGDRHLSLRADRCPHRPEWWKQPQQRPVSEQQHVPRLKPAFQPSDNAPFLAPTFSARSL